MCLLNRCALYIYKRLSTQLYFIFYDLCLTEQNLSHIQNLCILHLVLCISYCDSATRRYPSVIKEPLIPQKFQSFSSNYFRSSFAQDYFNSSISFLFIIILTQRCVHLVNSLNFRQHPIELCLLQVRTHIGMQIFTCYHCSL